MKKQFSLAYLTIPGTHPVDQIQIAATAGYDGVGLRPLSQTLPGEPDFPLTDPAIFANVRAALGDTGVKLMDIELARVADGVDVADYESTFDLAAQLGAKYAIGSIWTRDRGFYLRQFEALCTLAQRYGMVINFEFVPFSQIPDVPQALALMEEVGAPNVTLLVDTLHAHRVGVTGEQLSRVPAGRFGFPHLCDGPAWIPPADHPDMVGVARAGRLYAGEGGIDIAGIVQAIDVPYYAIELPNAGQVQTRGKLGHAAHCLETMKAYFLQNGLDG